MFARIIHEGTFYANRGILFEKSEGSVNWKLDMVIFKEEEFNYSFYEN